MQTHINDVRDLIAAVDRRGIDYIGYDDFETVMARSMLPNTRLVEAGADFSGTIRLQPDTSALPFHEVRHTSSIIRFCTCSSYQCKTLGDVRLRPATAGTHASSHCQDQVLLVHMH